MVTPMIDTVSATTLRHRYAILLLGILVAGGNAVAVAFAPAVAQRLLWPLIVVAVALLILGGRSMRIRPARLVLEPQIRAFGTPVPAWPVYLALSGLLALSAQAGALMRTDRLGWSNLIGDSPLLILIGLWVVQAARGHGAQLRPEGVRQSHVLGSLMVPWEAVPVGFLGPPTRRPTTLRLAYAEPQLVRRFGFPLSRHAICTDNVDAAFLAAAIQHYVDHPERRVAIGTHDEYQRLLAELARSHSPQTPKET
jgi:hypothetical protein